MAGERTGGPKVVDMPETPGRPTLPGKPGTPGGGGDSGKPGGPGDGRELPPATPPGRELPPGTTNPPPSDTPPGRPTLPGKDGPPPINIDGRMPPEQTNPDPKDNFNKGQVRDALFPNGMGGPTDPGGLGTFNPFNSGFGSRQSGTRGRPVTYDPAGIGQDNYGLSRPIGNRTAEDGSSENVYGMTGVNAATGYDGPARFGVVGGQGGYGSGMVAPEYTGPQFNNARDVLKAYRQQRRRGERPGQGAPVGKPIGGGGGGTPGGSGGSGQGGPGTPPTNGTGDWGKDMNYGQKPGAPAGGANGAQQGASGKPGSPAGADAATAGGGGGGGGAGGGAGGAGGKPGAPAPATPPAPAGGNGSPDGATPPSWYEAGRFNGTPFGDLVQGNTGNGNIYKKLNGSDQDLYHYDPTQGWKHMTAQEYAGYGNDPSFYKDPNQYAAQAGAQKSEMEKRNGLWQTKVGSGTYA